MADRRPKIIALLPAYNEARGLTSLLDRIAPHVDALIIVDDCSKDSTVADVKAWRKEHPQTFLIALPQNVGASGALKAGYVFLAHLLEQGEIAADDLVLEMDSDGQHDPRYIPELRQPFLDGKPFEVVLARRDFSNYPRYKRFGNSGLTLIASILTGFHFNDVESNFRMTRAGVFPRLLEYFSGYRYSGAFEVGIILASLEYRMSNEVKVLVPFYAEGARAIDGLHVLGMGLKAWTKVKLRLKNRDLSGLKQHVLASLAERPQ